MAGSQKDADFVEGLQVVVEGLLKWPYRYHISSVQNALEEEKLDLEMGPWKA